jgi:hypothetical protein
MKEIKHFMKMVEPSGSQAPFKGSPLTYQMEKENRLLTQAGALWSCAITAARLLQYALQLLLGKMEYSTFKHHYANHCLLTDTRTSCGYF